MKLVTVAFLALFSLPIVAQHNDAESRRPLDLPSGGSGDSEDEEDAPEIISFYGGEYEGDAFFFCLDTSCSMGWGGLLETMKSEVKDAVGSLSSSSEFSMATFSSWTQVFSYTPVKATNARKGAAYAWIDQRVAAGATCMTPAVVQMLDTARLSDQQDRRILVLSDGVPTCGVTSGGASETLSAINAANWENLPIDTIYIGTDDSGLAFMQQLAAQNQGQCSTP